LGIYAFFLGISIVFRSWLSMLFVAALFTEFLWRIQAEEALKQEFGEEWESYRAKSWRLIPFIF
jgi:protein-S-isoprenylcysteine O-methyltransferase Ste14